VTRGVELIFVDDVRKTRCWAYYRGFVGVLALG
jgi:hypothetical protein